MHRLELGSWGGIAKGYGVAKYGFRHQVLDKWPC